MKVKNVYENDNLISIYKYVSYGGSVIRVLLLIYTNDPKMSWINNGQI